MKKFLLNIVRALFFVLPLLLFSCKEDETERAYPVLKTHKVTDISSDGATFKASFINSSSLVIQEYGFVWSIVQDNANKTDGERISRRLALNQNDFSLRVAAFLKQDKEYYLRSYVVINELTIYGNAVKFVGQGGHGPEILSISPTSGTLGDTIKMKGKRFSYQNNLVYLEFIKTTIISATDTLITFLVPDKITNVLSGLLVQTSDQRTSVDEIFTFNPPTITGLSKQAVKSLDSLSVYGANFGNLKKHVKLFVNDELIDFEYAKDSLTFIVPNALNQEENWLKVDVSGYQDSIALNYLYPRFEEIDYPKTTWLDTVRLKVRNFDHNKQDILFSINGLNVNPIESNDTLVSLIVPEEIQSSSLTYQAQVAGNDVVSGISSDMKIPYIMESNVDTIHYEMPLILRIANSHPSTNSVKIGTSSFPLSRLNNNLFQVDIPLDEKIYNGINDENKVGMQLNCHGIYYDTLITIKRPTISDVSTGEFFKKRDTITIKGHDFSMNPEVLMVIRPKVPHYSTWTQYTIDQLSIISASEEEITFVYYNDQFDLPETNYSLVLNIFVKSYKRTTEVFQFEYFHEGPILFREFLFVFERITSINRTTLIDEDYGYILGGYDRFNSVGFETFYRIDLTSFSVQQLPSWRQKYYYWDDRSAENFRLVFTVNDSIYGLSTSGELYKYRKGANSWSIDFQFKPTRYKSYAVFNDNVYFLDLGISNFHDPNRNTILKYNLSSKDSTRLIPPFKVEDIAFVTSFDRNLLYLKKDFNIYDVYEINSTNDSFDLVTQGIDLQGMILSNRLKGYAYNKEGLFKYSDINFEGELLIRFPFIPEHVRFLFQQNNMIYFLLNKNFVVEINVSEI